jgi:AcrR family transcriptional regulator
VTNVSLRERKQEQVQRAIYEAAIALFAAQGFDETSVEQIVERAGVSRATYFNHFKTKHGVLRFYGERLADRLLALAAETAATQSPLERLRTLLTTWVQHTLEHREEVQVVHLYSGRDIEYLSGISPARTRLWRMFGQVAAEGQAAGELRSDIAPDHLAMHVASVFNTTIMLFALTGEPMEPLLDSAWKVILEGVRHANSEA